MVLIDGRSFMAELPVKEGETFLFIGDSITDCGRRAPATPLGEGYVAYFVDIATSHRPERGIKWINKGIGGDNIGNLKGNCLPCHAAITSG
jgi:hypothetical protein